MIDGARLPTPLPVEWWSPTLYNTLRRCPLALAYDRDQALRNEFSRPSTFSVLGNISHLLTEEVWRGTHNDTEANELKQSLSVRWDYLAAAQHAHLLTAWAPSVPPPPIDWPFYAKSKARTIARLVRDAQNFRARPNAEAHPPAVIEEWLSDEAIHLRGRPDRLQWKDGTYRVVDLKAGPHVEEITDAYLHQLLLYAHLVAVSTGHAPVEVAVVNSLGAVHSRAITAAEVGAAVAEFSACSAQFNDDVSMPAVLIEKATPSRDSCRRCPYRGICPAFLSTGQSSWDARVLHGKVSAVLSGRTFTMKVDTPQDLADSDVSVLLVDERPISAGEVVACVDVYPDGTPVRLDWNSILIRNGEIDVPGSNATADNFDLE